MDVETWTRNRHVKLTRETATRNRHATKRQIYTKSTPSLNLDSVTPKLYTSSRRAAGGRRGAAAPYCDARSHKSRREFVGESLGNAGGGGGAWVDTAGGILKKLRQNSHNTSSHTSPHQVSHNISHHVNMQGQPSHHHLDTNDTP